MKKILTIIISLLVTTGIHAQIIHITADHASIQEGINAASNGDTVLVEEGTFFENINFKGKAITVASNFILDGDTAHISKTIIDGSMSKNPDSTSTVTMCSGEDTTSVLMGFTITGGAGTNFFRSEINDFQRGGGGVYIMGSGGMITHNIIEKNHVKKDAGPVYQFGGGIFASVYNEHTLIIRENKIRSNEITADMGYGGGGVLYGGRVVCENNEIINNASNGKTWAMGGGMVTIENALEGEIKEVIIRNNNISGNYAITSPDGGGGGGGFYQGPWSDEANIQVYNNLICKNNATFTSGGAMFWDSHGLVCNNTIVDNTVEKSGGNNVGFVSDVNFYFFNNIIWSSVNNGKEEILFYLISLTSRFSFFNNILMKPFEADNRLNAIRNYYLDPKFKADSYELDDNSPAIGRGADSVQVDNTRYYSPKTDFAGNIRPNPADAYPDLGAYESNYNPVLLSNAYLEKLAFNNYELYPEFNREEFIYILFMKGTESEAPDFYTVTEDILAALDVTKAEISGGTEEQRTTTIKVTSSDGSTENTYSVKMIPVGIKDFQTGDLKLYPNPFSQAATLELQENMNIHRIEMVNMLGETVRIIDNVKEKTLTINRENLPSGLYFLRASGKETYKVKVMIE